MKAAVLEPPTSLLIQELECPPCPKGGAIVRVHGCGICGSDLDKLYNRQLQAGTVLGHEVVGHLHELSPEAQERFPQLQSGKRVCVAHHVPCSACHYCQHGSPSMCHAFKQSNIIPGGFSEYIAISEDHLAHTTFPLEDSLSDEAASCIEPLACCLRAVDRIPTGVGNTALVIGLGFIGLLTSQLLTHHGFTTVGIDLQEERLQLGLDHHMLAAGSTHPNELSQCVEHHTDGRGVDVVFLSVVNASTIAMALKHVRNGGYIVLFASAAQDIPLINQNQLYFREISLITSYSPALEHLQAAYTLIHNQQIHVDPLITHSVPLEDIDKAMQLYRDQQAIKVYVHL